VRLVHVTATFHYATAHDHELQVLGGTGGAPPDVGTAGWTVYLQLTQGGTAHNPSAAGMISFLLLLKNSTVDP